MTDRPLAIITGASAGLGAELARQCATADYDLVLIARRAEALQRVAEQTFGIGSAQRRTVTLALDVATAEAPQRILAVVGELTADNPAPTLVLINNAGVGWVGPFLERGATAALDTIALNVTATTSLMHAVATRMKQVGRGTICTIASVGAYQPGAYFATYYATKSYQWSLALALGEELRGSGVRSLVVCPGPFPSDFHARAGMRGAQELAAHPRTVALARKVLRAIARGGPAVILPSFTVRFWVMLRPWLPTWLVVRLVARLQRRRL